MIPEFSREELEGVEVYRNGGRGLPRSGMDRQEVDRAGERGRGGEEGGYEVYCPSEVLVDADLDAHGAALAGAVHGVLQGDVPPVLTELFAGGDDHFPDEFSLLHEGCAQG